MTAAHATEADLISFTKAGLLDALTEPATDLARASELIDDEVTTVFALGDDGLASDATVAAALRDATCAQVEFWAETGTEHDIDGLAGTQYAVAGYSGKRPPVLAPRARRILRMAGLRGQPTAPIPTGWWRW